MTRTLDRTRPFGTIFGADEHGGVFEQDGCKFNGQGECVYEPKATKAAPAPAAEPAAEAPASDDTRAKLEALHASAIKKLVEDQGMTPAVGAGSKARNIEMLLSGG